jgi:hypothetical protein
LKWLNQNIEKSLSIFMPKMRKDGRNTLFSGYGEILAGSGQRNIRQSSPRGLSLFAEVL